MRHYLLHILRFCPEYNGKVIKKKLRALTRFFSFLGYEFRRSTPPNQFLGLVQDLWPLESNFELFRIGGETDGAYLIPNCLEGNEVLISPGVGASTSFERDLFQKFGINSILIDSTVSSPEGLPSSFVFLKKYLSPFKDEKKVRLEDLYDEYVSPGKAIIQMDIEGAEYGILASVDNRVLENTNILVVEFHQLNMWTNLIYFEQFVAPVFDRLFTYFFPVHLKANTASVLFPYKKLYFSDTIELTFLSKRLSAPGKRVSRLPHILDVSNVAASRLRSFPRP